MIKTIQIQVDVDNNKTEVEGTGNSWSDLAYVLEGLAVVAQACVNSGIPKKEVYEGIQKYFNKIVVAGGYKVKKNLE